MKIATPNGEIIDTELEWWQICFCFYMAQHAGIGQSKPINVMLMMEPDDSFFSGAVARTFKFAYDKGYDACLEELCK